jgi:hypothetical protein
MVAFALQDGVAMGVAVRRMRVTVPALLALANDAVALAVQTLTLFPFTCQSTPLPSFCPPAL